MKKFKEKIKKTNLYKFAINCYNWIFLFTNYIFGKFFLLFNPLKINIMTLEETIKYICKNKCSVIRFGDGEFMYLNGKPIIYQKSNDNLRDALNKCIKCRDSRILLCLPEPLNTTKNLIRKSKWHWTYRIVKDYSIYSKIDSSYIYGNSFISRPYIVYKNKDNAIRIFEGLKKIWKNKNVIIIEGEYSRTGVGNDLLDNAKNISRIICPAENAYDYYESIIQEVLNISVVDDNLIILVALGPTAKPLTLELTEKGYWTIDIGHIDSEYEWCLRKVTKRVEIKNKHTAEKKDEYVSECTDKKYLASIKKVLGEQNE